jgi:hypothetical protein
MTDVILRAYSASTPDKNPDLVIREVGQSIQVELGGVVVDLDKNARSPGTLWNFQRLELTTGNTTVIIPTIAVSGDVKDFKEDRFKISNTLIKTEYLFSVRCHLLCLIGGTNTQVSLKIDFSRHKDTSAAESDRNPATVIHHLEVGDAKPPLLHGDVQWSQLTGILSGTYDPYHWHRLPYANTGKANAGPLLDKGEENTPFENDRVAEIEQMPVGPPGIATLQFTYRSSEQAAQYRIKGMVIPVDGQEIQVTQRASDEWISGKSGLQWKIDIRSALYAFWNAALERYRAALKTTRSVNRLTFLPRLSPTTSAKKSELNLLIRCTVDPSVMPAEFPVTVNSAYPELQSGDPVTVEVIFDSLFRRSPSLSCILSRPVSQNDEKGSLCFQMKLPSAAGEQHFIELPEHEPARIGSLDLAFGGKIQQDVINNSEFILLDLSAQTSKVPRFGAKLFLPVIRIDPAGQDGLPANEYVPENYEVVSKQSDDYCRETAIEQQFQGSAPLVISPYSNDKPDERAHYWAEITESNSRLYSQTVSIKIHDAHDIAPNDQTTEEPSSTQKVIVLDSDPFLVAEIRFSGFRRRRNKSDSSDVVAIWDMNRADGAAWELQTMAEPFDLVLPPQGIGEEMPKARELSAEDTVDSSGNLSPLDYRFSPPAIQTLDGSYTPQNFTEAPWNLRRILGYPGQRDAGAGIEKLRYELLYGLSCIATMPMLRLAEVFSTIGRIPGRLPKIPQPGIDAAEYAAYRKKWANYFGLYSKRIAVLEPRFSGANYGHTVGVQGASATPEIVTLENDVKCTFRSSASLYYRAESEVPLSGQPAVSNDEFTIDPEGLKGGVTWGFESPRIYHATVKTHSSSSAKLVNPYFSAIGGSGFQKVGFDGDLTTVYSNTETGRTFYYSVQRMGRMAVYHNLARHVIEYERSVSPGEQFFGSQTTFCGRPVLRKMREFIQILEPKAFLSRGESAYPECGCAKAIEFKTEIIPVDSSWGSNVSDSGWKVPIWKRSAGLAADSAAPPSTASSPAAKHSAAVSTNVHTKADGSTQKSNLAPKPSASPTPSGATISDNRCALSPYIYKKPEIVFDMAGSDGADVECGISDPEKMFFYTETADHADPDPHKWKLVEGLDFSLAPLPVQNPAFKSSNVNELKAYDTPVPTGLSAFTLHLDPGHGPVNLVHGRTEQMVGAVLNSVTFQRPTSNASKPDLQTQIEAVTTSLRADMFTAIRNGNVQVNNVSTSPADVATLLATRVNTLQKTLSDHVATQASQLKAAVGQQAVKIQGNLQQWRTAIDNDISALGNNLSGQWKQIDAALASADLATFKAKLQEIADNEVDSLFVQIESLQFSVNPLGRLCATADKALAIADSSIDGVITAFRSAITSPKEARDRFAQFSSGVNATLDQLRIAVQSCVEPWMPGAGLMVHAWEEGVIDIVTKLDQLVNDGSSSIAGILAELDTLHSPTSPIKTIKKQLDRFANLDQLISPGLERVHSATRQKVDDVISSFQPPADVSQLPTAIAALGSRSVKAVQDQLATELGKLTASISKGEADVVAFFENFVTHASSEVTSALDSIVKNGAATDIEAFRQRAESAFGRYADTLLTNLPTQMDLNSLPHGDAVSTVLQRAFGGAPSVPNLGFSLPSVGYFYVPTLKNVNLTPLLTQVSDLGAALSPLGSMLPSTAILDRMLPSDLLKNFNLSDVLPNFAGLKLDSLFSGLKMPEGADKYIKLTHGLDQSSRRAWVQGDIDFTTDTLATLFSIGPLALQLPKATFKCQVKLQADASGQIVKQATGSISGDWTLVISGTRLITMVSTSLTFDEQGHVHFNVSPDRVVLSEALNFIQQIIASYSAPGSGFTILPSATGIETRLDLPIPNTSAGTTGITNLTFGFSFGLQFAPSFAITAGFNLGRKKAPFNIAVFILGGAGYVETDITFIPGQQLICNVEIELAASASLAIAFGPISGYVAIFLGMSVNFHTGGVGGTDLRLGIFIQVVGEVSILSIVSAYVGLRLEATYDNGTFTGRGQFSISIKICWCFTLNVDEHVEFTLGHGGGSQQVALNEPPNLFLTSDAISDTPLSVFKVKTPPNYIEIATRYINMIS